MLATMCGRYASFRDAQDLADEFAVGPDGIADDARLLPPSWNLAPTDPVRVVVEREQTTSASDAAGADDGVPDVRRALRLARWGLVPGWAKDPKIGARMINARAETLTTKPAFRRAVVSRRCLIPAEGWYEWQPPPEGSPPRTPKQPFWIRADDGRPLAFAGLYEFWRDPARPDDDPQRWLVTVTIITGGAPTDDPFLAAIHDRRPVALEGSDRDAWLDPRMHDGEAATALLMRAPSGIVATRVSTAVNKVGNDGPQLLEPAEAT